MADAERILSQNEVDALLSAIDSGAQVGSPSDAAVPYDFRHPPRLDREQLRGLQLLHEGFGRNLQAVLGGLLRCPAEVKLAGVHAIPVQEALDSLPNPTAIVLLSCEPLGGYFLLEMSSAVAGPAVERLLGSGKGASTSDPRPLTALEWGVFDTLLGKVLDLLRDAWAPVAGPTFRILRRESDPGVLQLPRAEEMGVLAAFEVAVGEQRGSLDLIFPIHAVEGALQRLQAVPGAAAPRAAASTGGAGIPSRLAPAEVAVRVHLPRQEVAVGEIRDLRPGDLLVTSIPASSEVVVSVEGAAKFRGRLGRSKDHRAAKIAGPAVRDGAPAGRALRVPAPGDVPPGSPPAVEVLLAVPLRATAVIAEKRASLKEVLALRPGDLLEFSRRADAPLELRVGGRRLADGTAVKVGEHFGLRVTAVVDPRERLRALGT